MKKVLLTGATASQSSNDAVRRSPRFCGHLSTAISYSGNMSEISSTPLDDTKHLLSDYDSVVVGLSPFSSMSANNMYTALNTLQYAHMAGKAKILIDAPDPHMVYRSFKSVLANTELLVKPLYSGRTGYDKAVEDDNFKKSLLETMELVLSGDIDVIIPRLPYFTAVKSDYGIPEGSGDLIQLNFDSLFVSTDTYDPRGFSKYWVAESPNAQWAKNVANTLFKPMVSLRRTQYDTTVDYVERLRYSYGFVLNVYRNGTPWWSPNIMMALSSGVPVFSDWRHTASLGGYWSDLPHSVEDLSREERREIAAQQKASYLLNLNNFSDEVRIVTEKILV